MTPDPITINEDGRRLLYGLLAMLMFGLVCGFVGRCTAPKPECPPVSASVLDVRVDSVPYPVYVPRLVYKDLRAKVTPVDAAQSNNSQIRIDSVCPDFIAEADSINDSVRAHVWYYSAEQRFAMDIQWTRPLMPLVPLTTITKTNTNYEKREWWMDALTHVGAFALGAGVGSLVK